MKKYLDILLFTLLFFFIFSYFSGKNEQAPNTGIVFETAQKKYTIPADIILSLGNYTSSPLSLDTCNDITVRANGEMVGLPGVECGQEELNAGETMNFDLAPYYTLFETPGSYVFEYTSGEKKYIAQTDVAYRGAIGKLFVGVFYQPIYNLMVFIMERFWYLLGYAIIVTTILLRAFLILPQHRMMVSQRKMQAIQPKIKKLQDKYKGNQQQMGIELMKLYKEEGVNPMGSCGFLLIQMPFFLVMYNVILHITSPVNEFYLYGGMLGFHVDQINPMFFGLDLLASGGVQGIFLGLFVGGLQFIQVYLSLRNSAKDTPETGVVLEKKKDETGYASMMPDQAVLNKFMLYGMPAMIAVFTYGLIAGVGLYWAISTTFTIFQQLIVNKITQK